MVQLTNLVLYDFGEKGCHVSISCVAEMKAVVGKRRIVNEQVLQVEDGRAKERRLVADMLIDVFDWEIDICGDVIQISIFCQIGNVGNFAPEKQRGIVLSN